MANPEAAFTAGKKDMIPVLILFFDKGPRTEIFEKILNDRSIDQKLWEKVTYAKIEFKKDSDEAKEWKVTSAPTLLIIDNGQDKPKLLKAVRSGNSQSLQKEVQVAIKKLEKEKEKKEKGAK